jgi:Tfp pilus assembly protein PilN
LKGFKLSKITIDVSFLLLFFVMISLAAMPHILFDRYRDHVKRTHQTALASLQEEESNINSETAKYQTFKEEMKSIEEQEKRVTTRLNLVKDLQMSRIGPVNVLDAIGQALPQRVWLTNLELSLGSSNQVQLTGKSYSSEEIAEFVAKLNTSVYFENVTLDNVSTQKDAEAAASVKAFFLMAVPKPLGTSSRTVAQEVKGEKKQ